MGVVITFDGESPRPAPGHIPQSLPIPRTFLGPQSHREIQRIRVLVREQAAEIVAAMGPAALEIIADFRARKWAVTATYRQDSIGGEQARAHASEWQRITASVSMLMTL